MTTPANAAIPVTKSNRIGMSSRTTSVSSANIEQRRNSEQELRHIVLQSLAGSTTDTAMKQLLCISASEWRTLLPWLDISGLALYLREEIASFGLLKLLPPEIANGLQRRQDDNVQRTRGLMQESIAIQSEFQRASLSYAVSKGISLSPLSVLRPELRHQFDLDFLIHEHSAPEARRILEERGYRLSAISGKSWEFKINETPRVSAQDLYRDLPYRGVELHIDHASRLERVVDRSYAGFSMPVLSPVDLFVGQSMHAFKDMCSPFSRASHLLELYRHICNLRHDMSFWYELQEAVQHDRRTTTGIGLMLYLLTHLLGDFAPRELTYWTMDTLSAPLRHYVDRYGRRTVFSTHPGTKLYLLLQEQLENEGISGKRSIQKSLLPSRLPRGLVQGPQDEPMTLRLARYQIQLGFLISRLRFHITEGTRYTIEARLWQKELENLV